MTTIEIALSGLVVLNGVGLFLIRRKPAPFPPVAVPAPLSPMEGLRPAHDPHIHIVERPGDKIVIVETLRNGMLDPANHAKVGAVLASGDSSRGIQWHGGESNIEWAKEADNA